MKFTLIIVLFVLVFPLTAMRVKAQNTISARTVTGKEVVLYPDGTWKYASGSPSNTGTTAAMATGFTKSNTAKSLFKPDRGSFGVWYDENKWQLRSRADKEGQSFQLKRGDGYAMVIVEELGIPISALKKIAFDNAKEAAPDAKITFEETRIVNGKEILCMKIDGTIEQIPFRYYGYYYGGKQGTIQLLTYTGQSLFEKYEADFLDFLNGLEIY